MKKTVVIGAGFAGLSAAAYLAKAGRQVTILEKNDQIGGRARNWQEDGFRFDMGPSWYLMPEVFERFFSDFGKTSGDYYRLTELDPYYRVFFDDEFVELDSQMEKTEALFESFEPGGAIRLREYIKQARYKYDVAMGEFLYRDYTSLFDFFNKRVIVEGLRLQIFKSLDKFVGRYFTDRRARQILEYAMVFLGTSPKDAPALYSLMSHVDLNLGVHYPSGGLAGVSKAIAQLAESLGVEIRTGVEVTAIDVKNGKASGVHTTEGEIEADLLLSAADYPHTEMDLVPEEYRSYTKKYWDRRVLAPSMFIAYLGVSKRLGHLSHHNLYFSEDWHSHFDSIFTHPSWPDRPCYYASCISKTDLDAAPPGSENLFLLIPVAPGLQDSDEVRDRYFDMAIGHLERTTGEKIREHITVKRIYSHRDFARDYNAFKGTALGLSHTLGQTAIFRPGHRSKKVKNLYYTGQYTHPGIGVPMTLIASDVTVRRIIND